MKFQRSPLVVTPRRSLRAWLLLMLLGPATVLLAHPGHDHPTLVPPDQAAHWIVEPEHAIGWLGIGLLLWVAVKVKQTWTGDAVKNHG